jgi:hypothetical protein
MGNLVQLQLVSRKRERMLTLAPLAPGCREYGWGHIVTVAMFWVLSSLWKKTRFFSSMKALSSWREMTGKSLQLSVGPGGAHWSSQLVGRQRQEDLQFDASPGTGSSKTLSQNQNKNEKAGMEVKWYRACLACVRPWLPSQLPSPCTQHRLLPSRPKDVGHDWRGPWKGQESFHTYPWLLVMRKKTVKARHCHWPGLCLSQVTLHPVTGSGSWSLESDSLNPSTH